jgi:drug/metabolite transporter (DMT)-like permease
MCGFVTLQSVIVLIKGTDGNKVTRQQITPIVAGIAIMFLGNFIIMLPGFRTIPLDIASGVFYAMCLFYALYQKRLFRLRLFISRSNCYAPGRYYFSFHVH